MDWGSVFHEVQHAETVDDILVNTGLAYLLSFAWRAFLDSDDVVEGVDLHTAVETVARILRADPNAGDLAALARAACLSSSHLTGYSRIRPACRSAGSATNSDCSVFCVSTAKGDTTALAAALGAGRGTSSSGGRDGRRAHVRANDPEPGDSSGDRQSQCARNMPGMVRESFH